MILYALACINGHRFESWFRNGAAYDEQRDRGQIVCPTCHCADVSKTIMAPAVVSRGAIVPVAPVPAEVAETPLLDERQVAARHFIKALRERVLSEGENVGDKFSDQARQMHDGDIPHRHIHGQATVEEARALLEDGVAILPLPMLPEELN
jgi:hypothetical protein